MCMCGECWGVTDGMYIYICVWGGGVLKRNRLYVYV